MLLCELLDRSSWSAQDGVASDNANYVNPDSPPPNGRQRPDSLVRKQAEVGGEHAEDEPVDEVRDSCGVTRLRSIGDAGWRRTRHPS